VPNLTEVKIANGENVDRNKAMSGYHSLGHISRPVSVPKFEHIQPRDLKIYMQNDRVRNILHDNENLAKLANTSKCLSSQITTLTKMNTTQTNFILSP